MFVGDGPLGLTGACLDTSGRGSLMQGAGDGAGTTEGGGDILMGVCAIRSSFGRTEKIDRFGSVKRWRRWLEKEREKTCGLRSS